MDIQRQEDRLILSIIKNTAYGLKAPRDFNFLDAKDFNQQRFKDLIEYHELYPFLYPLTKNLNNLPDELKSQSQKRYYFNIARNQALCQEFLRINSLFKKEKIQLVPIKGISFLQDIYAKKPYRPMTDIDLLVQREDLEKSKDLFHRLGYKEDFQDINENYWLNIKCQLPFKSEEKDNHFLVELHFSLSYRTNNQTVKLSLWERLEKLQIGQQELSLLAPEDALLSLAFHQKVYGKNLNLKYALDSLMILKKYSQTFDWSYILKEAKRHRVAVSLYFMLLRLYLFNFIVFPQGIMDKFNVPAYKKFIFRKIITEDTFDEKADSDSKALFLKLHLLLYDSLWEPVKFIFKISKEHFAMFFSLEQNDPATERLYRLRFFYLPYKAIRFLVR